MLLTMLVVAATQSPQAPKIPVDLNGVTTISAAARVCQLTEAGLDWKESSPDTLEIYATGDDLTRPSPGIAALKTCFFRWAYDHNVKIAVNGKPEQK